MVIAYLLTGQMRWLTPVWDMFGGQSFCGCAETSDCRGPREWPKVDLLITCGFRHMVPRKVIERTRLGVVGFHSARLPEYPGRAPVPWAILRGDATTDNTMLFLTGEPDAGDIIDRRTIPVTTAAEMNRRMGETAAEMLHQHLPALLTGTAPREPQDRTRRGPLTTADGWQRLTEAQR
jgi:methionyl-tRNA formyltransferase